MVELGWSQEGIILNSPAMECIASLRTTLDSHERNLGPQSCVSKCKAPNRGMTSRAPISCRFFTKSRLLSGDNYQHQQSEGAVDTHTPRRRLQRGRRHLRMPSPPARQKTSTIFIRIDTHLRASENWTSPSKQARTTVTTTPSRGVV
jgi:hypothetical protein